MGKQTKLFTKAEIDAMSKRLKGKGDYDDPTGIYTRVRKKLEEIQAWNNPVMKKRLKRLLAYKYGYKYTKTKKLREQDIEDFKKNTGY